MAGNSNRQHASYQSADPILTLLHSHSLVPTSAELQSRHTSYLHLKGHLESLLQPSPCLIEPVGSFALDTSTPTSEIDLLIFGLPTWFQFIQVLKGDIDMQPSGKNRHFPAGSSSRWATGLESKQGVHGFPIKITSTIDGRQDPRIQISMDSFTFCIRYARVPELGPNQLTTITMDSFILNRIQKSTILESRCILTRLDTLHARSIVPTNCWIPFSNASRFLKLWAETRGVHSPNNSFCGFAGTHVLNVLLLRLFESGRVKVELGGKVSAQNLVKLFFTVYAGFGWKTHGLVWDGEEDDEAIPIRDGDALYMTGPTADHINLFRDSTPMVADAWVEELERASRMIEAGDWEGLLDNSDFLQRYKHYIRIDVSGTTAPEYKTLETYFRMRLAHFAADLHAELGSWIRARLWNEKWIEGEDDPLLSGVYVFGLTKVEDAVMKVEEKGKMEKNFKAFLETFENDIRTWSQFNASSMFINIYLSPASTFTPQQNWKPHYPTSSSPNLPLATPTSTVTDPPPSSSDSNSDTPKPTRKLRPSSTILSYILHTSPHPHLYTVTYLDRFTGLQEMPFLDFMSMRKDEGSVNWMPLHRVWGVKKSGEVVWDRKEGIDRVV
ncbi:hypothetical protein HDV05_007842 [Chytridiales sp. JEL 0842]|nr:hypothetical protein HDV05_007842 [Chytridiales sp. JEL 0842]